MMTIKNTFHRTETKIRAKLGEQLTASQTRRASRKLCGVEGCACGAFERDPDHIPDYNMRDGRYEVTFYER